MPRARKSCPMPHVPWSSVYILRLSEPSSYSSTNHICGDPTMTVSLMLGEKGGRGRPLHSNQGISAASVVRSFLGFQGCTAESPWGPRPVVAPPISLFPLQHLSSVATAFRFHSLTALTFFKKKTKL